MFFKCPAGVPHRIERTQFWSGEFINVCTQFGRMSFDAFVSVLCSTFFLYVELSAIEEVASQGQSADKLTHNPKEIMVFRLKFFLWV